MASAGSSSTCSFRNRTLMRPSAMAWFAPLASSTMSVKQLYTCTSQLHVHHYLTSAAFAPAACRCVLLVISMQA